MVETNNYIICCKNCKTINFIVDTRANHKSKIAKALTMELHSYVQLYTYFCDYSSIYKQAYTQATYWVPLKMELCCEMLFTDKLALTLLVSSRVIVKDEFNQRVGDDLGEVLLLPWKDLSHVSQEQDGPLCSNHRTLIKVQFQNQVNHLRVTLARSMLFPQHVANKAAQSDHKPMWSSCSHKLTYIQQYC